MNWMCCRPSYVWGHCPAARRSQHLKLQSCTVAHVPQVVLQLPTERLQKTSIAQIPEVGRHRGRTSVNALRQSAATG